MKQSTTTIVGIFLAGCAIFLGQITSAVARGSRGGEGGVADASNDCASAPNASVGSNPFNTTGATVNLNFTGSPCGDYSIFNCKFFNFIPILSGVHIFSTCGGSEWDTMLVIISDCNPTSTQLGCNDDACNYQSTAAAVLVAGTSYKIIIGGYGGGDMGPGDLLITEPTGGPQVPDVIVGAIPDVSKYGSVVVSGQTIMAYSFGTTSCNIGTGQLSWYGSPDNRHPFIPMNMYRYKGGRIEQIGMSWGKHGFCALQGNLCGACIPAGGGCPPILGIGCSDPYDSGLNGGQGGLGTRREVNAATGFFPGNFNSGIPAAAATIGRRLQVVSTDLDPLLNANAIYLAEGQYIHPEDAAAGKDNNNASWRQITVGALTSGAYTINLTGPTNQQHAAIEAWQTFDSTVSIATADVVDDGRFIVGYTVKSNGSGKWRYEYAVQNLNSDRAGRSFSMPIPAGVAITNQGFKDINYHSSDPYDPTNWTISIADGAITWTGGTYATSPNGNALRFATLYNFWFDADTAPISANATIGLFKPGAAGAANSVSVSVKSPGAPINLADINNDGFVNGADLAMLIGNWGGFGIGDINGSGTVDGFDLTYVLSSWN